MWHKGAENAGFIEIQRFSHFQNSTKAVVYPFAEILSPESGMAWLAAV
jgi:hypothetical protein